MPDDNFERKADQELSWFERRERAGIPSQEQITFLMQQNVLAVRSDIIASYTGEQNVALLKQLLGQYKSDVQKNMGISLSKPLLCATFLSSNVGYQLMSEARNAFNEDNMGKFRLFYDFSACLIQSLSRVMIAEAGLSDVGEGQRLKVVSYEGDRLKIPVTEQAQQYLHTKEEDAESLELLRKDHSGFLLMDDFVERVKAGRRVITAY